jgi:hypothetical protein
MFGRRIKVGTPANRGETAPETGSNDMNVSLMIAFFADEIDYSIASAPIIDHKFQLCKC